LAEDAIAYCPLQLRRPSRQDAIKAPADRGYADQHLREFMTCGQTPTAIADLKIEVLSVLCASKRTRGALAILSVLARPNGRAAFGDLSVL
jgi:hypothetical protein